MRLAAALAGLLVAGCARDRIAPEALAEGLRSEPSSYDIVDVRSEREFHHTRGHIDGATHLPWPSGVRDHADALTPAEGQTVVLVCFTGHRSRWAIERVRAAVDNEVIDLRGGMMRWWARDLPVVSEPAVP